MNLQLYVVFFNVINDFKDINDLKTKTVELTTDYTNERQSTKPGASDIATWQFT